MKQSKMASIESSGIRRYEFHDSSPYECFAGVNFPSADDPFQREEKERSFMQYLKDRLAWYRYYCYQKMMHASRELMISEDTYEKYAAKNSYPYYPVEPINLGDIKHFSYGELMEMTKAFRLENVFRVIQFGRVINGCIEGENRPAQNGLVKTLDFWPASGPTMNQHPARFVDELNLLKDSKFKSDPRVMKLIGFHCDKILAIVYEAVPLTFVFDSIPSDYFGWDQRMELTINMGEFLKEFHDEGLVHGGIDSMWILIDENYSSPKSFLFKMNSYNEGHLKFYDCLVNGRYGQIASYVLPGPEWKMEYDVAAYGILLLELISKNIMDGRPFDAWFEPLKSGGKKSHVHESFSQICDERTGRAITSLAFDCLGMGIKHCPAKGDVLARFEHRPAIGDVLEQLKGLINFSSPTKKQKMSD